MSEEWTTEDRYCEALLKWALRKFPEIVPPTAFDMWLSPIIRDPNEETLNIDYELGWHTPSDMQTQVGSVTLVDVNTHEFHHDDHDQIMIEILEFYVCG